MLLSIPHDDFFHGARVVAEMRSLAERIRFAVKRAGQSYLSVDRAIGQGAHGGYTSRLASGEKTKPDPYILRKIAGVLSVSFDWLVFGEGELAPFEIGPDQYTARSQAAARLAGGKYDAAIARVRATPFHGAESWPEEEWIGEIIREHQRVKWITAPIAEEERPPISRKKK